MRLYMVLYFILNKMFEELTNYVKFQSIKYNTFFLFLKIINKDSEIV